MLDETRRFVWIALALVALGANSGLRAADASGQDRPETWAKPLGELPGLSNFFQVSDELYRGAQPREAGFEQLRALGIKTVVNLRTSDADREACRTNVLRCVHIPMRAWRATDGDLVEFLEAVTDPDNQPVFVHCRHGSDRTGVAVAVYRIAVQGWSKDDAVREMTQGGFGFHPVWHDLIDYVRRVDAARIRELAGLANSRAPGLRGERRGERRDPSMQRSPAVPSRISPLLVDRAVAGPLGSRR